MQTVLVVEDNYDILSLFSTCLSLCGVNVIQARTLQDACEAFEIGVSIDAIMVDFRLPDGEGPELLLRLGSKVPKVRILVTGYDFKLRERFPGFTEYLTKPVDCGWLCDWVKTKVWEASNATS